MIEIIRQRRRVEMKELRRVFQCIVTPGAGFSFLCDEDGNVDSSKLTPDALENWESCIAGANGTEDRGVEAREWSYTEPSVGRCYCGREVELDGFTSRCDCGSLFNSAGQQLCDPQNWGEETGEHPCDLLRVP